MKRLAPSILSADFANLGSEIQEIEKLGADWFHVDVMDGHFVPNMTIGPIVVQALRPMTKAILDCHLMVQEPEKMIPWFVESGANYITIHLEAASNPKAALSLIREAGVKSGLSIKPKTKITEIEPYLADVDLVLVMSVEPGFGGQKFMPEVLSKVSWLVEERKNRNLNFLIEIDGGINSTTIEAANQVGVDVFVAGSAIFGAKDRQKAYAELERKIK